MINRIAKYSWLSYSFLILAIFPATVESGAIPAYVSEKMAKIVEEKQIVTEYLASKYNKSTAAIGKIVSSVYKNSEKNGLEPTLVLAVIEKESGFDPKAESNYGAVGLMQVVPRYHTQKIQIAVGKKSKLAATESKTALTHPDTNIKVGTEVMAEYASKAPNMSAALKQYSGSARNYAERVFAYQHELKKKINEGKPS